MDESFGSFQFFSELVELLQKKQYPAAYQYIRMGGLLKEQRFWDKILLEALNCTDHMFRTVYETIAGAGQESPQSLHFRFSTSSGDLCRSPDYVELEGGILEAACALGKPAHIAYLLEQGLPEYQHRRLILKYYNQYILDMWSDEGESRLPDPPLLVYAMLNGNLDAVRFLLERQPLPDPENITLQTAVLKGLYTESGEQPEGAGMLRRWCAETVAEAVYGLTEPMFCPMAHRLEDLPADLEDLSMEQLVEPWPVESDRLPMERADWVVAQGLVAPIRVLRRWYETGRYGLEEALAYLRAHRQFQPSSEYANHARMFQLSAVLMRYVPEVCSRKEFQWWLFATGLLPQESMVEAVLADREIGLLQVDHPVMVDDLELVEFLLTRGSDTHQRILEQLHNTCGVCLAGPLACPEETMARDNRLEFFPQILRYCTRAEGQWRECSILAYQIACHGSVQYLWKALSAGFLAGEPWDQFMALLKQYEAHALIPIALANGPKQKREYVL